MTVSPRRVSYRAVPGSGVFGADGFEGLMTTVAGTSFALAWAETSRVRNSIRARANARQAPAISSFEPYRRKLISCDIPLRCYRARILLASYGGSWTEGVAPPRGRQALDGCYSREDFGKPRTGAGSRSANPGVISKWAQFVSVHCAQSQVWPLWRRFLLLLRKVFPFTRFHSQM